MIKDFLIINLIGKENKIGLKINNNFYIHDFDQKTDNEQLVSSILNMIKKHKVKKNTLKCKSSLNVLILIENFRAKQKV